MTQAELFQGRAPHAAWTALPAVLVRDIDRESVEPVTLKLSVCGQAAVEQLNGMEMNGYSVEVEPAHGAPGGADRHSARSASIFVKGFGPEASLSNLEVTQIYRIDNMSCLRGCKPT